MDKKITNSALELISTRHQATEKFEMLACLGDEAMDRLLKLWSCAWGLIDRPEETQEGEHSL